jgi:hypothetical protein
MTDQHSITPPPELVEQWWSKWTKGNALPCTSHHYIATQAAQWGADQELEACCEWVDWKWSGVKSRELRASRRPKPPSLKEQALEALKLVQRQTTNPYIIEPIRRALEALYD